MEITANMIKELREQTGAGVLDCKKALETNGGDFQKAIAYLKEKGLAAAAKRADRAVPEGVIGFYVHPGSRVAGLVEVNCETDFVARTSEFQQLAKDLAMHVVAMAPKYLSPEDIPAEVVEEKRRAALSEIEGNKPSEVVEKIVQGKLEKFYNEVCLLRQAFIKDETITVQDLVTQVAAKVGENTRVRRFVRYEVGEEL
ncbi:MAG: translation elongation factor Ts [Anaerolineae bacterium]|nr:translation elongation factor Ts [Anaerolineae bacterium]